MKANTADVAGHYFGRPARAPAGRAHTLAFARGKRASARPRRVLARIVQCRRHGVTTNTPASATDAGAGRRPSRAHGRFVVVGCTRVLESGREWSSGRNHAPWRGSRWRRTRCRLIGPYRRCLVTVVSPHLVAVGAAWDGGPDAGGWIADRLGLFGASVGHPVPLGCPATPFVPIPPDDDLQSEFGGAFSPSTPCTTCSFPSQATSSCLRGCGRAGAGGRTPVPTRARQPQSRSGLQATGSITALRGGETSLLATPSRKTHYRRAMEGAS